MPRHFLAFCVGLGIFGVISVAGTFLPGAQPVLLPLLFSAVLFTMTVMVRSIWSS